tara:strand:+ start:78 stop:320 length:243 start_codon:yes stop_codon:yes gene_type:complete
VTWKIKEYQFWANKSSELHKKANFLASMIAATSGVLSPYMPFQIQRRFQEMGQNRTKIVDYEMETHFLLYIIIIMISCNV